MPKLQAGVMLVVKESYSPSGDDWFTKKHILYVVSDLFKSEDAGNRYWCLDILNPQSGKIATWRRHIRRELIEDVKHYHELISNE